MGTRRFRLTAGEWCILVGVIGLLAAAVRPSVSQAMSDRQLTDLVGRLYEVRAAVALYKADHAGLYPGQRYPGGTVDAAAFVANLTAPAAIGARPYLSGMPKNPYLADAEAAGRVMVVNHPAATPVVDGKAGWWFNAAAGRFCALDSAFHAEY